MASIDDLCIALDVGGTRTRVGIVDGDGNIIHRDQEPTQVDVSVEQTGEWLAGMVAKLMPLTDPGRLIGIGAALAGPVDPETCTIYNPPNLPGWNGFSPRPPLEQRFNLPVWAFNDATLGAMGEHAYGAGQGVDNLVYLTVSTGIGGGVIVDGRPVLGARGFAAELGHMVIDRNGPPCSCGGRGCLEAFASGTSLARFARERLEQGEAGLMLEMVDGDLSRLNAGVVTDAADMGDPLAMDLVRQFAEDLGLGLANLLHIFDPEVIVLGGGVSRSYETYAEELIAAIRRYAMANLSEHIRVTPTVLGDDAPLLGAACLAFQRGGRLG